MSTMFNITKTDFEKKMNFWKIKAKLYKYARYHSIFRLILKKENRNLRLLLAQIPTNRNIILDMGCGDGNVLSILKTCFPKMQIIGLDITLNMLKNINMDQKTLRIQGDVSSLPFKQNIFELCSAVGLVEYLKNDPLFLKNLHQILKVGGYAVISFAPKNVFTYLRFIHGIKIYAKNENIFKQQIIDNGFTIISIEKSLMQTQYLIKKND